MRRQALSDTGVNLTARSEPRSSMKQAASHRRARCAGRSAGRVRQHRGRSMRTGPQDHGETMSRNGGSQLPAHNNRDRAPLGSGSSATVLCRCECAFDSPVDEISGFGHAGCPRRSCRRTIPVLPVLLHLQQRNWPAAPCRNPVISCAFALPSARGRPRQSRAQPRAPGAPQSQSTVAPIRLGARAPPSRRPDAVQARRE